MKFTLFSTAAALAGLANSALAMTSDTAAASAPASEAVRTPAVEFVDPLSAAVISRGGGDLSPVGMFAAAGGVVQTVIVLLLIASLVTWVIGVAKWVQLKGERERLAQATRKLKAANDLAGIGDTGYAPISDMVEQADDEIAASSRPGRTMVAQGVKDRIGIRLDRLGAKLRRHAGRSVGVLAIVSSTAPFLGLFGTVWGIMDSFIGIAHAHTTSLAVVAPGIAEALLTTAVGLMAAIPAAILYNIFARTLSNYASELGDAGAAVLCMAGREIDQAQGKE